MFINVANLHALCFPHKPWGATDFADLKKSGCEIVASENGFIVWRAIADEAELITIGVAPNARRGGIATAMITIMENSVKKNGVKKIFLEVSDKNTSAIKLYEQCGFTQIGTRQKYYSDGTNAILMQKNI